MGELRRCSLGCKLILDPAAPDHGEMVAGPKRERRVKPHCDSPTCTWCATEYRRRDAESRLDEKPDKGA